MKSLTLLAHSCSIASMFLYIFLSCAIFYPSDNNHDLHRIMDVALDKAIKEIIGPVIQRSVTIASRTTKELILKVNIM
jgi:hypothetical protein